MSMFVGHGFRLEVSRFEDVLHLVEALRKDFAALAEEETRKYLVRKAASFVDMVCLARAGHPEFKSDETVLSAQRDRLSTLSMAWRELIEDRRRRAAAVDLDFSIMLYPYEGEVYGTYHSPVPAWRDELFLRRSGLERFPWWDGSDRPDEISAAEWARREEIWKAIFAATAFKSPKLTGLEAHIVVTESVPYSPAIDQPHIDAYVLPKAQRALDLAESVVFARHLRKHSEIKPHQMIYFQAEIRDFCGDEIEQQRETIEPILYDDIRHLDLLLIVGKDAPRLPGPGSINEAEPSPR